MKCSGRDINPPHLKGSPRLEYSYLQNLFGLPTVSILLTPAAEDDTDPLNLEVRDYIMRRIMMFVCALTISAMLSGCIFPPPGGGGGGRGGHGYHFNGPR